MRKTAAKRDFGWLLIAFGSWPACAAEPAEVLTVRDGGQENDSATCAPPSDCDAGANESTGSCACVVGASVGCLETLDSGDAGCAAITGTKRCQADGSWTPCLGPVTVDTLRGISCTLVSATCGPLGVFSSSSGDCTKALRCPARLLP